MKVVKNLKKKLLASAFVCASAIATDASAAIIIDVTDVGGNTQFSFSGSDTIATSGSINNGFWFNDLFETNAFTGSPNYTGQHTILSGSAALNINSDSYAVQDVWVNGSNYDYELAFRSHTNPHNVSANDLISLTGSIVVDLNFDWFNPGLYTYTSVGPYSVNEATVSEGIIFNVGVNDVNVPEPAPLALVMLGLAGLIVTRKKQQA